MVSSADKRAPALSVRIIMRRLVPHVVVGTISIALLVTSLPAPPAVAASESSSPSATFHKLRPAALRGDREALREVAKAIVKIGPREFPDSAQMRGLLRLEAMRGSSAAANAYGMMLQRGIGGPAMPGEAPLWYARGSQRGNISASKNGAQAYALGWGVRRDTRRAMRMLAEVPIDQRVHNMLQISKALLQPGREEPETALMWLQKAISLYSQGSLDATQISRRIAELDGGSGDQMRVWLQPLADRGNGAAAMILASHLAANGKHEDQAEALRFYLLAAEKGIDGAYKGLGTMITSGSKEVAETALARLEEQARTGTTLAKIVLGDYYLFQSAGTQEMRKRGEEYLQQAAKDGDPEAQYKLAMLLLSTLNDEDEINLAKAYLVLSARGGNRMADIAVDQLGSLSIQEARQIVEVRTQ